MTGDCLILAPEFAVFQSVPFAKHPKIRDSEERCRVVKVVWVVGDFWGVRRR